MERPAWFIIFHPCKKKNSDIYANPNITISKGAIVRMDTTKEAIYLTFTGHEFAEGFDHVIKTLSEHNIKASFFLTGDFFRIPGYDKIVAKLKDNGHYIGAHSDKHLLYCTWENRDSLLVTKSEFITDLENNYKELEKHGISKNDATVYLPPYEWYNETIGHWTKEMGLKLVNNSPGTVTAQDWTFPEGDKYYTSEALIKNLLDYESEKGLNGYILLIHPGTDPRRTDKLYLHLDSILDYLKNKNYSFHSFSEIN